MTATFHPVPDSEPPVALPTGMVLPPLRIKFTREGNCMFREIRVPIYSDFTWRNLWKSNKGAFLERGFGLRSHDGSWYLSQWLRIEGDGHTLTAIGQERLDSFNGVQFPVEEPQEAPELPALSPKLEAKLFDYQVQPARQLLNALNVGQDQWGYPGAWDCSDLGTGKTFQALAAAIATGLEVGVICPLSVIPAWKRAFAHFGQHPRFVRNYEALRTGKRDVVKKEQYVGANGKMMRRFQWQLEPKDTVLLFDEAHSVKNVGTLNQGLAMAAIRQRFPLIFISGTLASDPTHMRATGRAVGLHTGDADYARFLTEYGCYGESKSGKGWSFQHGGRGRTLLAHIHRTVFPQRGARVRIADLGDRFPETQILAEAFETGETQAIAEAFKAAQRDIDKLEAHHQ